MKKFFIMIFLILSLSSCFKMNSELSINENLVVDSISKIDFSQINSMSKSIGSTTSTGTNIDIEKKLPCDSFNSDGGNILSSSTGFKEITCKNIGENIAEITSKGLSIANKIKKTDKGYFVNLNDLLDNKSNGSGSSASETEKSMAMLKSMGFEANYKFNFPTNIIESSIGKIDGKILTFSIYDLGGDKVPYVVFGSSGVVVDENSLTTLINNETNKGFLKQILVLRTELDKTIKGKNDRKKIDKLIPLLSDSKLLELKEKLSKIDKTSKIYIKNKNFLEYMEIMILGEIYNRGIK